MASETRKLRVSIQRSAADAAWVIREQQAAKRILEGREEK
jgi:hypothetical protein